MCYVMMEYSQIKASILNLFKDVGGVVVDI